MFYSERAELILQQLKLKGRVKINDLTEILDVSVDTVRRDLKMMEQNGLIKCVRGGACLPDSMASFLNYLGREIVNIDLKQEIARKAMAYVKKDSVIALNAGTTNTILAQELALRCDRFTVITNNIAAINILQQNPDIRLIAVGGMVDSTEKSTYGSVCEEELRQYYPDVAFLSISAVNDTDEFTDFRFSEAGIIKILAEHARKVIAVMDSSKIGKCSKKSVLHFDQVDKLIMDRDVPENLVEEYRSRGLEIE